MSENETAQLTRAIGRLEGTQVAATARLDKLAADVDDIKQLVAAVKGSYQTMVVISVASATVAGLIVKFI